MESLGQTQDLADRWYMRAAESAMIRAHDIGRIGRFTAQFVPARGIHDKNRSGLRSPIHFSGGLWIFPAHVHSC
jgi:hypothetical protein